MADKGGTILLSTTYGDRRNVVLRLSLAALAGADALAYFSNALAERHEEACEGLEFFIRLPAPGSISGVAEFRVDSAADLRSLKCVCDCCSSAASGGACAQRQEPQPLGQHSLLPRPCSSPIFPPPSHPLAQAI